MTKTNANRQGRFLAFYEHSMHFVALKRRLLLFFFVILSFICCELKYWKIGNPFCIVKLINSNRFVNLQSSSILVLILFSPHTQAQCLCITLEHTAIRIRAHTHHMSDKWANHAKFDFHILLFSLYLSLQRVIEIFGSVSFLFAFFFSFFVHFFSSFLSFFHLAFVEFNLMFSPHLSKCSRI